MKKGKILIVLLIIAIPVLGLMISAYWYIDSSTDAYVYSDSNKLPYNRVGLLLGTAKMVGNGNINQFFARRINAAVELFKAGKIDYIVVSGDNRRVDYNEPLDMQNELMKAGIDKERIYLDYAGFRTYDSMIRMNKIFGQSSFTVISQDFHIRRAVYIARRLGMNAVGYRAKDADSRFTLKTKAREVLSRVVVFVDFIIEKEPHFLGDKIEIGE
jgi:SanA protein